MEGREQPITSFARRFAALRDEVYPKDRKPYTAAEIARGTGLSKAYVNYLLSGERDNPTRAVVRAIAGFFNVPEDYFSDGAQGDRIREQVAELAELRALKEALDDKELAGVIIKARGLDPARRRGFLAIVNQVLDWDKSKSDGAV
ncbi:helix-turn-helix domain-containing protein [Catenuloplanes atrovinosus]|uniref:Transcriptional regulator with XRE-family HTH domain n=1 Tax=Catenuloplanes atrovinosus TaxID=137266 RepID=A0AAE3YTN4_9ACTN|nr:helix-turn-helix domain-containing protein [Catenuloplanes atrovinosus]MDR7277686.1 transcriptional regulator with XRE-family HTH domain [Catenuloplanes atrovinosus]